MAPVLGPPPSSSPSSIDTPMIVGSAVLSPVTNSTPASAVLTASALPVTVQTPALKLSPLPLPVVRVPFAEEAQPVIVSVAVILSNVPEVAVMVPEDSFQKRTLLTAELPLARTLIVAGAVTPKAPVPLFEAPVPLPALMKLTE